MKPADDKTALHPARVSALGDVENGYPVVILPEGKKAPRERGWQEGIDTPKELEKRWDSRTDQPNYGIVLRAEDRLLLADVDVKNGAPGVATFSEWIDATGLDPKPYSLQRTPSGGGHFLGRIPAGYPTETLPNTGTGGVDLFRSGRQFVRAPSETPAGGYKALRPLPPIADLPEWPVEFLDHLVSIGGKSKGKGPTPIEDAIPKGSRDNALTSLAGTMRHRGMTEAEIAAALVVTNQDRCSPPLPEVDVLRIARSVSSYPPGPEIEAPLYKLNETYAVVQVGSDVRIMQERGNDLPIFMTPAAFGTLLKNRYFRGRGKPKPLATKWLAWSKRRGPYQLVFLPGVHEVPYGQYNLWRGWGVTASAEGSCDLYLDHLLENVVDGNRNDFEWLLDWLAHLFQHPMDRSLGIAVALRGEQGVGKSFVGDQLKPLLGRHHTVVDKPELLTGRFNKQLATALLVQSEEAFWAGDRKSVGPLKHLVTGRTTQLELKGIDAQEIPNFVRLLITTNEERAWPTDLSDRRLVIFDVSTHQKGDRPYFRAIEEQLKGGGYEKLLHILLTREIDQERLENPPVSRALVEQAVLSMSPEETWLHALLESGEIRGTPYEGGGVRTYFTWLFEDYLCSLPPRVYRKSEQAFGYFLKKYLPSDKLLNVAGRDVRKRIPSMVGGQKRSRVLLVRPLPECRAAFSARGRAAQQTWDGPDEWSCDYDLGVG
jgi:hypothetical protein